MMIDSTSSQSAILKAFESRISSPEGKEKAAAIEKASKVGTVQHQRTLAFLTEKLESVVTHNQAASTAAASEASLEVAKKDAKRVNADKVDKKGTLNADGKPIAADQDASSEEMKKEAKKENANKLKSSGTTSPPIADGEATQPIIGGAVTPPITDSEMTPPITGGAVTPPITGGDAAPADRPTILPISPMEPPKPPPPSQLPPGFSLDSIGAKELRDHNALLTSIMIAMSNLLSDDALERVDANRHHQAQTSKVNLESINKLQTDQIEEQKKADEANKIASCAMQVAMAIVSVIMVVISVVTMNPALLIVSLLGIGLMIVDAGLAAAGKTTLSEMIMSPFIDYVLMPMAEFFGGIVESILLEMGVDEETAAMVGMVLGLLMAVAVIIGAAVAMKNSTIVKAFMKKIGSVMGNILSKLTPNAAKALGQKIMASSGRMVTSAAAKMNVGGSATGAKKTFDAVMKAGQSSTVAAAEASLTKQTLLAKGLELMAANATIAAQATALGGAVVSASSSIASNTYQFNIAMTREELTALFASITTNSEMMKGTQEYFKQLMENSNMLLENALEAQAVRNQTAIAVINSMSKNV